MGLKTDITSLGAIGLGTAIAVIGTGGVLVAGALHQVQEHVSCVDVDVADIDVAEAVSVPDVPGTVVIEINDELRDVVKAPEAPDAPKMIVSTDVRVEIGECADKIREQVDRIRVRAEAVRADARAEAAELREHAGLARELAEEIRAEAEELREAALAEAARR